MVSLAVMLQDYCTSNPDEISRIAACQKQVQDVKGIMVENVEKVGCSCSVCCKCHSHSRCLSITPTAGVCQYRPHNSMAHTTPQHRCPKAACTAVKANAMQTACMGPCATLCWHICRCWHVVRRLSCWWTSEMICSTRHRPSKSRAGSCATTCGEWLSKAAAMLYNQLKGKV